MTVYVLETFDTDRALLYKIGLYKLSKISGEYYRYITQCDMKILEMIILFPMELVLLKMCLTNF